jgi:hypothetical protein
MFFLEVLFEAGARVWVTRLVKFLTALAGGERDPAESDVGVVLFYVLVFAYGRRLGQRETGHKLAITTCVALVVVCTTDC